MRRKFALMLLVTVIAFGFFGALTKGIEIYEPAFEEYVCPPCGCGNLIDQRGALRSRFKHTDRAALMVAGVKRLWQ